MGRLGQYEVLKRVFWEARSGGLSLDSVEVVIVDRTSTGGERVVRLGAGVILMKDRLVLSDVQIPLHRLVEIRVGGERVWRREKAVRKRS